MTCAYVCGRVAYCGAMDYALRTNVAVATCCHLTVPVRKRGRGERVRERERERDRCTVFHSTFRAQGLNVCPPLSAPEG